MFLTWAGSIYGLKMSQEVKANHLVGVKSVYRNLGLGDGQVRDIYRRHIDASVQSCSGVGAIVVHKSEIKKPDIDVFATAWEYLLTRLRKRTDARQQPILIVHDQGEEDRVRKHLRRFRRANWQGAQFGSARLLVEDPVPRNSPPTLSSSRTWFRMRVMQFRRVARPLGSATVRCGTASIRFKSKL
jgi:hypothetical protein